MKTIISYFAIAVMLLACSKTEPPVSSNMNTDDGSDLEKSGMIITTAEATIITSATATSGGNIQTNGGGHKIIERGVCYNTSPHPKVTDFKVPSGSGKGSFTSVMSGLSGNTKYYVRAYAIKKNGHIKYGNQIHFKTLKDYGTVTDIDGNVYHTITIGTQVWMVENLKTTKYRDGTSIPNITDDNEWLTTPAGAYCDYDNDPANSQLYGRLYNSNAASNSLIAPDNWHVPSMGEFNTLLNYLGSGNEGKGGHLKEAGLTHWNSPNTGADNSSGFTALPAGMRQNYGEFMAMGGFNSLWTSSTGYQLLILQYDSGNHGWGYGYCVDCLQYGCSVRCVKD